MKKILLIVCLLAVGFCVFYLLNELWWLHKSQEYIAYQGRVQHFKVN